MIWFVRMRPWKSSSALFSALSGTDASLEVEADLLATLQNGTRHQQMHMHEDK